MNLQPRTRRAARPLLPQKIILEIRRRNSTIRANLAAHVHVPRTRMWVCHASVNMVHHSLGAHVFRYFLHTLSHLLHPLLLLPPSRVSRTRHNLTNKYISAGSFAPRENHGLKGRETEGGCYTMRETQERADSIFRGNWIPRRGFGRRKGLKPIPVIVNIYYLSCRSFRFVSTYTTTFKRVGFLVELGNFERGREGVGEFVRLFLVNISCLRVLKVVNLVFIFLN